MAQLKPTATRNGLLAALTFETLERLQPRLDRVSLKLGQTLIAAKAVRPDVYFPEQGVVSILANTSAGQIEVGLIGREGMVGVPAFLGVDQSPYGFFVQAAGTAMRISQQDLRAAMVDSPALSALLMRYIHVLMVQTAQTAYANARFSIEARLARWILMTHDRSDADDLPLTQDLLSMMLGTQRTGVTVALKRLKEKGLIHTTRGHIIVLDRANLEVIAGEAYGVAEAEYAAVIGGTACFSSPALRGAVVVSPAMSNQTGS